MTFLSPMLPPSLHRIAGKAARLPPRQTVSWWKQRTMAARPYGRRPSGCILPKTAGRQGGDGCLFLAPSLVGHDWCSCLIPIAATLAFSLMDYDLLAGSACSLPGLKQLSCVS